MILQPLPKTFLESPQPNQIPARIPFAIFYILYLQIPARMKFASESAYADFANIAANSIRHLLYFLQIQLFNNILHHLC